jgi:hypothetical protein
MLPCPHCCLAPSSSHPPCRCLSGVLCDEEGGDRGPHCRVARTCSMAECLQGKVGQGEGDTRAEDMNCE